MLKTKRSLKEMQENLYRLKGGENLPIKSPYKVQREQENDSKLTQIESTLSEAVKKIEQFPDVEEILKSLKNGGKNQLELRDIKGARLDSPKEASQAFIKDHISYKIEELMHGAGSGTGSGGGTETPDGLVNGVNRIFTVRNVPVSVVIDGFTRYEGKGYTYASGVIVTDELDPPAEYIESNYSVAGGATNTTGTFYSNEVVSGSGTSFALLRVPATGSEHLYGNGVRLTPGVDYTIVGTAITIISGTFSAGTVLADYNQGATGYIDNEVVDGSGTVFVLLGNPTNSAQIYGNGIRLTPGVDYTIAGRVITIISGTFGTGTLLADYAV